ncbi:MAG: class I SAM-dependent methyltransferase [Flavobacteriales bacterium]|nr:class I SAM-dependent methyltransferase [Flavobacteriales bacterium]
MNNDNIHTYSAEKSSKLDNRFRRLLQNPHKILSPFISKGMTIVDLGCSPGFFTIPMAEITRENGQVIAVDIQAEMLDILQRKLSVQNVNNVKLINSSNQSFNKKKDFVLCAYVIHELPNKK